MMHYVPVHALILLFVFYTSSTSKGQTKTDLSKDTIKFETKDVITSQGPSTSVRDIHQDRKGNMWLASNQGIFRYDGKSFTNITTTLTSDRFTSVVEDRNGNFWFGTDGSGVYHYDGKSFKNFTTKQGLGNNRVSTIYEDKTGTVWFGADGAVSRYNGKSFQNFITEGSLNTNFVNAIVEDKGGKLWFGTRGYTYVYDGKTFTDFNRSDRSFTEVWSILEDKKGNLWFGGLHGLWRSEGSALIKFTEHHVTCVYEDKKGNIWTSSQSSPIKFELSRYDQQSLTDTSPRVVEIAQSMNMFRIIEANDGSIWFGAVDGVYRYDGTSITDFKSKQSGKLR